MADLEDAIALAVKAHRGQKDKAGAPYILHPLRLMLSMKSTSEMVTAVLHDVVEDTPVTQDDLKAEGYEREVLIAIDCLTNRESESYDDFIERIRPNALATRVKLADLRDNMDITRIAKPTDKDLERLRRYQQAWARLNAVVGIHVLTYDRYNLGWGEPGTFYEGFADRESAMEFSRRWLRDSLETLRKPGQTKDELHARWSDWGEEAVAYSPGSGEYRASRDLDTFIDHPATPAERDWRAILNKSGVTVARYPSARTEPPITGEVDLDVDFGSWFSAESMKRLRKVKDFVMKLIASRSRGNQA